MLQEVLETPAISESLVFRIAGELFLAGVASVVSMSAGVDSVLS
jgi:hypothetical protein